MKTRDQILADNPLIAYLRKSGIVVRGEGNARTTTRCPLKQHKPDHRCVSIDAGKQLFNCHACGCSGTIIDWLMLERGQSASDVLKSLGDGITPQSPPSSSKVTPRVIADEPEPQGKPKANIVATYDYVNESHQVMYQAVRLEPKSFRQRKPNKNGDWDWSMEGVTRILYNLPAVLNAKAICVCEGEKDCNTLNTMGHTATTNVGGAGKWLPAYAEHLKGKDIVVFPDNDNPGRKHASDIIVSLDGKANSIKQVIIPEPYKDVTEFVESFPDREQSARELVALIEKTAHLVKPVPIYSMAEMEAEYRAHAKRIETECFDLGKFLPDFRGHIRPMVAGEVLLVMGDTGIGKSLVLQQLLRAASPLPSLFFELELPSTLLFERFVQMEIGCYARDVQEEYREQTVPLWKKYKNLLHIHVCPESGLTTEQIEAYIVRSELKIGRRPVVVAIDYVGLLGGGGQSKSRYEAVSKCAEQLKVIAKRTGTIMIIASQIARPAKDSLEIGLHSAKDSGSLECSAGVVLGVWRPEKSRIMFKILKNTSGTSGEVIEANMDGSTMRITSKREGRYPEATETKASE